MSDNQEKNLSFELIDDNELEQVSGGLSLSREAALQQCPNHNLIVCNECNACKFYLAPMQICKLLVLVEANF